MSQFFHEDTRQPVACEHLVDEPPGAVCSCNGLKKFILVYQGGIANLFEVLSYGNMVADKRVFQGAFHTAESMARGAMLTGAEVRVASCNRAGDIADAVWTQGLSDCPFRDHARPPRKL